MDLIFDAYLHGWSQERIAGFLSDIGCRTKTGSTQWNSGSAAYFEALSPSTIIGSTTIPGRTTTHPTVPAGKRMRVAKSVFSAFDLAGYQVVRSQFTQTRYEGPQ